MTPKYRAYIKSERRMVEVAQINFRLETIAYTTSVQTDGFIDTQWHYANFDNIVLMLGVEINGKIVYEGDIVEAYWSNSPRKMSKERVTFNNGTFRGSNIFDLEYYTFEIIGNKFEHPHLLEA